MTLYSIKPSSTGKSSNPRILCVVDSPNWIFARHVSYFKKFLSDDFWFDISFRGEPYNEDDYDLIYPLEFNMVSVDQIKTPEKYVTGIRSFVAWADWNILDFINFLNQNFQKIHVVSRQLFDLYSPFVNNLSYVTHGVDMQVFQSTNKSEGAPGVLRLGWAGNRLTYVKGFKEFITPLGNIPGIELTHIGFHDVNLSMAELPAYYDKLDGYICASSFEGNNNSLLEAASMEKSIITTPCGTALEYLTDNVSALIVNRDYLQIQDAAMKLRDDVELRVRLGKAARQALINGGWDWMVKAEDYRQFFWDAILLSNHGGHPARIDKKIDYRALTTLLQEQVHLLRDLRIGTALDLIDSQAEVRILLEKMPLLDDHEKVVQELRNLKSTKFYYLYAKITSSKIISKIFTREP